MAAIGKLLAAYDYIIGGWLITLPWLFNVDQFAGPTSVSVLTGLGIIVNSLFSNMETGLIRFIPAYVHYVTDILTGILLCVAPWLFDYYKIVAWPHVGTGLLYISLTFFVGRQRAVTNM